MTSSGTATADYEARLRIQTDLDSTLFVEAGAGTGKTHELIERLFALVSSGRIELRNIAAITFTESAAAELRDRVRIRLEEALASETLGGEERARCDVALHQIDEAAIETLHAFAQRILNEHPLEAGLPPIIEVQDEIRSSINFEDRWRAFFDALLDNSAMEDVLLRAFALGVQPAAMKDVARHLHDHWDRLERIPPRAVPLRAIDVGPVVDRLRDACLHMNNCTGRDDVLYLHLVEITSHAERLAVCQTDIEKLQVLSWRSLHSTRGRQENWRGVTPTEIRDTLKEAEDLRVATLRDARAALLEPIVAELQSFVLNYAAERRRQGQLEFHDLLVLARNLLRDDAEVRKAVSERFGHLLIDEFQDTDPLQIEIATIIASPGWQENQRWQDANVEEGRLFFVGDPKQSIYRFRRADIQLYQAAQERFSEGVVRLTDNFRSRPPIIRWINHIFSDVMGQGAEEGQIPYVKLTAARDGPAKPLVRVLGGPSIVELRDMRQNEAREIARVIQNAREQGWTVHEGDEDRPARYADIALLLPTRTTLGVLEQELEDAGIPYRVESRSLVYNTPEVRDLLSVLRAIDDPTDQVALIAALRSPAFACGDDDLLRYSQAGGRWDYRSRPPETLPEADPVVLAMAELHDFHNRRWWQPISAMVEMIIRERRLFELAFAHRRPRERWQRLRFILDQSRAFAEAGGRTLRQFVEWAERQAVENTRIVETVVPEPDDDAVRVMTVHAAKGLEFPIVIVAGLNVQATTQRRDPVLWDGDGVLQVQMPAGPGRNDPPFETPGYSAAAEHETKMDAQEKVRLLYVAATRARDHLVLSLHHEQGKPSHASVLTQACTQHKQAWEVLGVSWQRVLAANGSRVLAGEDTYEQREAWIAERDQQVQALARVPAIAATELAKQAAAVPDDPLLEKEPPVEEIPPWRRGRAGTAIGRAVHAVLQSIDLASGDALDGAAAAQSAAEGVPNRAKEVAQLVSSALRSNAVREAVASGRFWRELYVGAPVEGVVVEGFIDLLYETSDGLVIVDYKTDKLPSPDDLDAALVRYRLQGAAYAAALEQSLEKPVARCVFVFTNPSGAIERTVDDLTRAIEDVRALVRRGQPITAPA